MMLRSLSALAVAASVAGCGKAPDSSARPGPAAEDSREAARTSPGPATNVSAPGASAAELAGVLDALTQALRQYSFEQHRLPKTLDEVVAAGYVKAMPPAPSGKKFGIDSKTVQVVLVKQ